MAIMRGLTAESVDRDYRDADLIRRIGGYFAPWRGRLAVVVATLVFRSLLGVVIPVLIAEGVDRMAARGDDRIVTLLILAVTGLGISIWFSNWLQRVAAQRLIGDVVLQLRENAFNATLALDMSFFDQFQSGRIVSRISSDSDEFGRVAILVADVIGQLAIAAMLLVVLARIELRLTILLVIIAPIAFFVAFSFRRLARRVTQRSQRAIAEVNVAIQEAVTGIGVAKNFRREAGIYDEFSTVNDLSYDTNVRRGLVLSSLFPTLNAFSGLGSALLLYYGGLSVLDGTISAGAWFLFISSVGQFWFPMINLSAFWSQFQAGLSASERIFALMDAVPEVQQVDHIDPPRLRGDIEFDRVTFSYRSDDPVLQAFSVQIQPGETVALVGHTGAGKSSIAKLVTRFYEFQAGSLRVDGMDIRRFDLARYRAQLGVVSQQPFLVDGTVADNIRYGGPEMTDEQVRAVAERIGGTWLEALTYGLQTDVGERGARLSLGQRQLVVLARMLAREPAIFILDEATASVDPFTEANIQQALEVLLRDRTSIVIAHRLSTVRSADRILVLDRGRIIEQGTHDALMADGGHYAELYDTYFRHQSLDYVEGRAPRRG